MAKQIYETVPLQICGKEILLTRKNIKRIRLSIDPKTLLIKVNAPACVSVTEIQNFVETNIDWIEDTQQRLLARKTQTTGLKNLRSISFFGEKYPLRLKKSSRFGYKIVNDEILLQVRDFSDEEIQRCMTLFYKKELALFIEEILPECEKLLGEKVQSLNYRSMKTKLGSCAPAKKSITLNTRLAQYTEACIRMVLIHEIVHFKEFYHNARFKSLMTKYCPDWQKLRRAIKQHAES